MRLFWEGRVLASEPDSPMAKAMGVWVEREQTMNVVTVCKSVASLTAFGLVLFICVGVGQAQNLADVVAHYTFDSDLTSDSGPNNLDLTASDDGINFIPPLSAPGMFGNGVEFDTLGYLWNSDPAFNLATGNFAVSLWYKAKVDTFTPLVGKNSSGGNQGWATFHNTPDSIPLSGDLNDYGAGHVLADRPADDTTVFHHLVFNNNFGTLELYVDGVLADKAGDDPVVGDREPSDSDGAMAIGARNINADGTAGGDPRVSDVFMDEVWIFDGPLVEAQVIELRDLNTFSPVDPPKIQTWGSDASGDWGGSNNWLPGSVPNGNDFTAIFGDAISAPRTVLADDPFTVSEIRIEHDVSYAIAGHGTITLEADSGNASIDVSQGTHEFQARVALGSTTDATVAAGAVLNVNNELTLGGNDLNISGGGTFNINNIVNSSGGTITASGALGTAGSTSIAGGLTLSGASILDIDLGNANTDHFDVTGNVVLDALSVLDVTLEPGFVPSGSYTILTASGSLADNGLTLDGSDTGTFSLAVNSNTVVLTALGCCDLADLNMDGFVDGLDLGVLLGSWNTTTTPDMGELNGKPPVDGLDLGILLGAWNTPPLGGLTGVPEPTSAVLLIVGLAGLTSRRRVCPSP